MSNKLVVLITIAVMAGIWLSAQMVIKLQARKLYAEIERHLEYER